MQQRPAFLAGWRGRLVVAVCVVIAVAGWALWQRSSPPLNLILVTFDTTRADRLGAYGYRHGMTDAFDQLASQGVRFEQAYAPVPLTLPSHTTMLTGLYPPEHGLHVNGSGRLGDAVPFLPELLKRHGYETGAFLAAFVLNSKFGLNRGFDVYDDDLSDSEPDGDHSFDRRRLGVRVVDSALNWLEQRTTRPFFCWVHLYDAHAPYSAREELFGDQFKQQPYDAGIAVEVQQLARLLKFLKDRQLNDRTLIVVVGDHGEGLDEHGEDEHGLLLYNSTVRVPLVVVAPRDCRPGHHVDEPVSLVDLTPTLMDMVGLPAVKEMRGRSLKVALAGGNLSPRPCYIETEAPFLDNRWCPMQAVVSDHWKYIHTTRGELFDLEHDPGETKNLWETAVDQREEMYAVLQELQQAFVPAKAGNVHLSETDRQILASLGYVGGRTENSAQVMATEVLPDMKEMLPYLARIDKVRHLAADGDLDGAVKLARDIVAATTPKYPMAELLLGDLLRKQGEMEESATVYQAILARQPDNVKAHARLGSHYASQSRWPDAAKEFRAVIKLEPEASQAHFDLAQTLSRMDQYDEAIREFQEAIRSDPGFVTANFELGMLLAKSGRLKESVYYFERALKYEPRLVTAHLNLGSVLVQLKRVPEALNHLNKAVEADPESFDARFHLGSILLMQKQHKQALAEFRAAQKLRPDDPRPGKSIEQLEATIGRGDDR